MNGSGLAGYAVRKSMGRRYPTQPDPHREDFRRDIGRVLYAKAFRRLAFKTQVFSPSQGDHYRNRLTHTLETAQIARVAAGRLSLNGDLAEVIALAHDLGHPPFGHQGEAVLDDLMSAFGGFDHNLQNLRIVTLLETKSIEFPGLNLCYETLFGIAKGEPGRRFLMDLYGLESDAWLDTCEARVADWADDLAYTATDFDDYARYHGLSLGDLIELPLDLIHRCLPSGVLDVGIAVSMCVRNLVSVLVTDMIESSLARIRYIGGDAASVRAVRDAIGLSQDIRVEYDQLAGFLRTHMYHDADLKARTLKGASALRELFNHERQRRRLDAGDREGHLELCDYLSGMTDHYALECAQRLGEGAE